MQEIRQAAQKIREKKFSPVYVLYGAETFLLSEFLKFAEKEMLDPEYKDMNFAKFDCKETPLENALLEGETSPFFGEHRMVIIEDAYFLTGAKAPSKAPDHDVDALLRYLDNPPNYSSIFIIVDADKLDGRKKVTSELKKKATILYFAPLKDAELYAWVEKRAKHYGVILQRPQTMHLVGVLGPDLRLLDKEVDKISLYAGPGAVITDDMIKLLASPPLDEDVFSIFDNIASRKVDKVFSTLHDLFVSGEEPIKLIGLLARQFRMMLLAKTIQKDHSQQEIATMLKLHPYAAKKTLEQARRFSEESLREFLSILAEEDFRMKTGKTDKRLAIEVFISKVCNTINRINYKVDKVS
jgi:DNA polymerase III subunit delta